MVASGELVRKVAQGLKTKGQIQLRLDFGGKVMEMSVMRTTTYTLCALKSQVSMAFVQTCMLHVIYMCKDFYFHSSHFLKSCKKVIFSISSDKNCKSYCLRRLNQPAIIVYWTPNRGCKVLKLTVRKWHKFLTITPYCQVNNQL